MVVIVKKEVREIGGAMNTRLIEASISPFPGHRLDKAFGLAIGLRAIGLGEEMFDSKLLAGGSEVVRAVGNATIGEHALDGYSMSLVKFNGLMKSRHHTFDFLIGEQAGKSQLGVIINGDVQAFNSSAAIAQGAVPGGAHSRSRETAQLLDVEVKKLSRSSAFVTLNGRFWRLKCGEPMQVVTAQDARNGGLGDAQNGEDLSVRAALPTQRKSIGFEFGAGPAGLPLGNRRAVMKLRRKTALTSAGKPSSDSPFADVVSSGDRSEGKVVKAKMGDHFSSHLWGKSGISVHVVRAGF